MIRLVLDTNVLVSIALPGSRLHPLMECWQKGESRLLISLAIFEEYLRVLTYPKFRLSAEEIRLLLEREVRPYAELVRVTSRIHEVASDPSDDKFLACAVDGRADWLVTGDRHLLGLREFRRVRIGTPAQFLRLLKSQGV